jgi:hypothetical protein
VGQRSPRKPLSWSVAEFLGAFGLVATEPSIITTGVSTPREQLRPGEIQAASRDAHGESELILLYPPPRTILASRVS